MRDKWNAEHPGKPLPALRERKTASEAKPPPVGSEARDGENGPQASSGAARAAQDGQDDAKAAQTNPSESWRIAKLLDRANHVKGAAVSSEGGKLVVRGKLPPKLAAAIHANEAAILECLDESPSEVLGPAAFLDYNAASPHPAPGQMVVYHDPADFQDYNVNPDGSAKPHPAPPLCEGAIITQGNTPEQRLAVLQLNYDNLALRLKIHGGTVKTKAKAEEERRKTQAIFDKHAAGNKSRPKCIVLTARERYPKLSITTAIRKVRRQLERPKMTKG
ncbi:MAG: hypothetical protein WBP56_14515 [Polyangia bacterium]